jgi:hypothetical protein
VSEYEIGRDLQDLRRRVEALEGGAQGREAKGKIEKFRVLPETDPQMKPLIWKQKKGELLPPFLNRLLDFHPTLNLDGAQTQTWTITPEPWIINVNWDAGGTDEFCRFVGQQFTILRATDPNTGTTSASGWYEANLIASGLATNIHDAPLSFNINLRNAKGGYVGWPGTPGSFSTFSVNCRDNLYFSMGGGFNPNPPGPGLYDLVAGASFDIPSARVHGC